MNPHLVKRIADAVLYEGYILYPYRPSIKNRQRWTFGGLYPEDYCRSQRGTDACSNQTECLVKGGPDTTLGTCIRFLHLTTRTIGEIKPPLSAWPKHGEPAFRPVESLRIGDKIRHSWQEAEEREVALTGLKISDLLDQSHCQAFTFGRCRQVEPIQDEEGAHVGVLVREQHALVGFIEVSAAPLESDLFRLTVRVRNNVALPEGQQPNREAALLRSLISAHTILQVEEGEFVSLLDPPPRWHGEAAQCKNVGVWPVLVGEQGERDAMLSSPIILYDYPQIAPESPGDFFDATEIDEMLSLRILTMTGDEKKEMSAVDQRARALLARTEALDGDQLMRLHGTLRGVQPGAKESSGEWRSA